MAFIKEESEDVKIEETFSVKQEETEEQTDLMPLKGESQDLNETKDKDQYETHCDVIAEEKSFSCSQTESPRKRAKKTGIRTYFTCQLCGINFSQPAKLEVHMRVHTGENPFTCQQCGKSFTQKGNFNVHMRIHTGETPFTCNLCGKSFSRKDHLGIHMRVHTGEKPFTCPQCGKSFKNKASLGIHTRVHTGEKPFTCPQCGKSFARKGNLDVHVRLHTGEKPYKCLQCEKSFTYHRDLKCHSQTHSGKKLQGFECGKKLTIKGNFKSMKIHTNVRPYSCSICRKSFKWPSSLKWHQKICVNSNTHSRRR